MAMKSDYERLVGGYVKVFSADGNLYGKLNEITDNNIILNPHLDETWNSEGIKGAALIGRDLMYARGAVRGMSQKTEEEIKGLEKFAQSTYIKKENSDK